MIQKTQNYQITVEGHIVYKTLVNIANKKD